MRAATHSILTKLYSFADRSIVVQSCDEEAARIAEDYFRNLYFAPLRDEQPDSTKVDYVLRVMSAVSPPPPFGAQEIEVPQGACYTDGESFYFAVDDSVLVVGTRASQLIEVFIGSTPRARHPVALINIMTYAVQALLRRIGLFHLHAAGVVDPQRGAGALIVGDSGAGKSTLTMQLAQAGWHYLTDDLIALSERNGEVTAYGLRRIFSAAALTLQACGLSSFDAALGEPLLADPSKRILYPALAFPNSLAQKNVPRTLFFSEIGNEATSRVVKLSQTKAMTQLLKHSPWAGYDTCVARGYLQALVSLAKQCDSYKLIAGRDILNNPLCAATLLAPYMSSN